MEKRIWCMAVVVVGGLSLLGCGKKTSDAGTDAGSGGATASAGSGASGASGGGAAGSSGRAGGAGTGTVAKNVDCHPAGGTFKCAGSSGGLMVPGLSFAETCCADPATMTCGAVNMMTKACDAPPAPEPRCPSPFMGIASSCCTADNLCGVDASLMGRGCLDFGSLQALFGGLRGRGAAGAGGASGAGGTSAAGAGGAGGRAGGIMGFTIPKAQHCDGTPIATDAGPSGNDAGI